MKKLLLIPLTALMLVSCANSDKRMKYLKEQYPNRLVEPATGLIQSVGYEFIIIEPETNQITAVSFYWFSETKIWSFRSIR